MILVGNLDPNHTSLGFSLQQFQLSSSELVCSASFCLCPLHSPPKATLFCQSFRHPQALQGNGNGDRCSRLRSKSGKIFDMPWTWTPNSTNDFCLRCSGPDCLNLTVPSAPLNSHITTNECLPPTTFPSFRHPSRLDQGYLGPLSETNSRNSCQPKRGYVPAVKSPGQHHHFSRQQVSVRYLVFFDTGALSHPALSSLPPASSLVTRSRPVDSLLRTNCG
ncbi:hypothetical protein QBC45DRAFT_144699 [Copromyces sp. CBS 386.78]|nr:hypothetical protein QBC45DRAFT_144699 [Copromyces sp. CBS 386.78]